MKKQKISKRQQKERLKDHIKSLKSFSLSLSRQIKNGYSAYGGTQKNRIQTLKDNNILLEKAKAKLRNLK